MNRTEFILNNAQDELLSITKDCWSDMEPTNPYECDTEKWINEFKQFLSGEFEKDFRQNLIDPSPFSWTADFMEFNLIDWNLLANEMFDKHVNDWIDAEQERYDEENMTDEDVIQRNRDMIGDMQYDDYVDRLINDY